MGATCEDWKEGKFSIWRRELGHVGTLTVEYTSRGYRVTVLGSRLTRLSETIDEAKSRAEHLAKVWLDEAQEALKQG